MMDCSSAATMKSAKLAPRKSARQERTRPSSFSRKTSVLFNNSYHHSLRAIEFDLALVSPVDGGVECWINWSTVGIFAVFAFGEFFFCTARGFFARLFLALHFFLT